jgi:hypothetical protein
MQLNKLFTAAALCSALVSLPAAAAHEQGQFSAIEGIDAQALTAAEMDAVHGALTVTQIRTALVTALNRSTSLSDALKASVLRRFDLYIAPRLTLLLQQVTVPQ